MSFSKMSGSSLKSPLSSHLSRCVVAAGIASTLLMLMLTDFHGNPLRRSGQLLFTKTSPQYSRTSPLYHDQTQYLPFEDAYTFCRHRRWDVFPDRHRRRKIYDLTLVNDELDWLEIRLEQMYHQVDFFVVVEAEKTFTGNSKPLFVRENWERFERFHKKIILHTIDESVEDLDEGDKWAREVFSRNAMSTQVLPFLTGDQLVEPKDVILVSDVDEIPRPSTLTALRNCDFPERLTLRSAMYYYSFQWLNRQGADWLHPQATFYRGEDTVMPNDLRTFPDADTSLYHAAWHCSWCQSNLKEIVSKVTSFSHTEYNSPENRDLEKVLQRIRAGKDIFDRGDSDFDRIDNNPDVPDILLAHPDKYSFALDRDPVSGNFKDYAEYFENYKDAQLNAEER